MKKKSLFDTNPYLKDQEHYRKALITSVSSSTAIETGASIESVNTQLTQFSKSVFEPTSTKSK